MAAKRISQLLLASAHPRAPLSSVRAIQTSPRRYATTKQPNPTTQFYKTFTRPVAKVLLLAVFTYQVVYWSWVKLEADEARVEADSTIAKLEAQVGAYAAKKAKETGKEGNGKTA